jgi:hypothetical protein
MFVAVAEPAVFVGSGAAVSVTEASIAFEKRGVLNDPQAKRKKVTSKINPTRLIFIIIFTSNDSIIPAKSFEPFERVK